MEFYVVKYATVHIVIMKWDAFQLPVSQVKVGDILNLTLQVISDLTTMFIYLCVLRKNAFLMFLKWGYSNIVSSNGLRWKLYI